MLRILVVLLIETVFFSKCVSGTTVLIRMHPSEYIYQNPVDGIFVLSLC